MEEIWKPVSIPEYSLSHQVSNLGRIKSLSRLIPHSCGGFRQTKEKILKTDTPRSNGYCSIQLSNRGKNFLVHRLVALAFLPNPEKKEQVNHIDGNKVNNTLANLEWLNQDENQNHAYSTGLQKGKALSGKAAPLNKPVIMFDDKDTYHFDSVVLCANHLGTKAKFIYRVLWGQRANHKGYKFKYKTAA